MTLLLNVGWEGVVCAKKMLLLSLSSETQKPEPISVSLLILLPAQKDTTMGTSSKGKPRGFFSFFFFIREASRFTKEVFLSKHHPYPKTKRSQSAGWISSYSSSPQGYIEIEEATWISCFLGKEKLGWLEMEEGEEERRGILGVRGMWPWWHFDFSAAQEKRRSTQSTPFCFAISREIFSRKKMLVFLSV